jgi:hypothetical protein
MKKAIVISAIALLAACGGTTNDVSVASTADQAASPPDSAAAGDDDTTDATISVDDLGDMPQECVDLLGAFLKKIEPKVSSIDWNEATLADFEAFSKEFEADSSSFDAQISAAGCNNYSLNGSDDRQFEQMAELAAAEAPGTLGYLQFLNSLASSDTATGEPIPSDCADIIAAIEEFLADGGSMQDLTMAEVTRLGQLMTGVSDTCTAEESTAFFARDDLTTYLGT